MADRESASSAAARSVQDEVALGCRVLEEAGLDDLVWGHLGARDPEGRGVWMKSSGLGLDEVRAEDVILVGWDGATLAGQGRRPIEYHIHTETMAARPDVGATVHAHASFAIAFMATGRPLRPISHDGAWLAPPDPPRFVETGGLIRTPELGQRLAAALGDGNVVMMPNHGVLAVGTDVPYAVMTGVLLERSCRLQLLAQGGGGVTSWSSDEEALAKREECWPEAQIRDGWRYLVRRTESPE